MSRFLRRLWRDLHAHVSQPDHPEVDPKSLDTKQKTLRRQTHETIAKVSDDYGRRYAFNTAIASCMELLNALSKFDNDPDQSRSDQGRAVRHEAFESMCCCSPRSHPIFRRRCGWRLVMTIRFTHTRGRRRTKTRCARIPSNSPCRSTASCVAQSK